jgi:uncharacterized protein with von Willebrand factor type A (vWA) domain
MPTDNSPVIKGRHSKPRNYIGVEKINEKEEDVIGRINSLLSNDQSINDQAIRRLLQESKDKWNVDESTPDLNKLLKDMSEDNDFIPRKSSKGSQNHHNNQPPNAADIMVARLGQSQEETKHENSVSDSINDEIEKMLNGSFIKPANSKSTVIDPTKIIRSSNSRKGASRN